VKHAISERRNRPEREAFVAEINGGEEHSLF
jgi:hypothetical protein